MGFLGAWVLWVRPSRSVVFEWCSLSFAESKSRPWCVSDPGAPCAPCVSPAALARFPHDPSRARCHSTRTRARPYAPACTHRATLCNLIHPGAPCVGMRVPCNARRRHRGGMQLSMSCLRWALMPKSWPLAGDGRSSRCRARRGYPTSTRRARLKGTRCPMVSVGRDMLRV